MGSICSSIRDDDNQWSRLKIRHGIQGQPWTTYSQEHDLALKGIQNGHYGEDLVLFVGKEKKLADLRKRMQVIEEDWATYLKLKASLCG